METSTSLLVEGARILTEHGTAVVVAVTSAGVKFCDSFGNAETVGWADLTYARTIQDGQVAAVSNPAATSLGCVG